MQHQVTAYLKFLWASKNQHGVHSPFVYQLVTKCFYDKSKRPAYQTWQNAKQQLLQDSAKINVEDFGSGSRVFKTNLRPVNQIAKHVGISKKRAQLLNRLCSYLNINTALELGTSLGLGSLAICLDNNLKLNTVEACQNTLHRAEDLFKNFNCKTQITTYHNHFKTYLKQLTPDQKFDLIYIDGHHDYKATLHYFDLLKAHAHNESLFIFDDIHWSKGMSKAWKEISNSPEIHVSIDTFNWGLCFFRPQQAKQNFTIRL